MFRKILIANRGEIAVRICRTATKMQIPTLAIYAEDDKDSLHVNTADDAVSLGSGQLSDTYLNIGKIIEIAQTNGCDAIHPGYGFLSENPQFVKACEDAGIIFIGPSSKAIALMGNKIAARKFASEAGVPITKGYSGSREEIIEQAASLPFPVLIKAAAGGGGKGMRIVREASQLKSAIESTSREAASYFGDGAVYVEQFLESPRHIEVQILGDQFGEAVHLYERECSLQRRYQKIIEEAPSPTLDHEVRREIGKAAVKLAKAIPYANAGTIEFLLDQQQQFYFLEMNTRIQVEHPVTEMTTGIDLVEQQIKVAAGKRLSFSQEDIAQKGHAIECRIYAESPENNFLPSPGEINYFHPPTGANYRLDTFINGPARIQSSYDPMIAKLVVYGHDREQSRKGSIQALKDFAVHGIDTNISYLLQLLGSEDFIANRISTKYCDQNTPELLKNMLTRKEQLSPLAVIAAGLAFDLQDTSPQKTATENIWKEIGYWRLYPLISLQLEDQDFAVEMRKLGEQYCELTFEGALAKLRIEHKIEGKIVYLLDEHKYTAYVSQEEDDQLTISLEGMTFSMKRYDRLSSSEQMMAEAEQAAGSDQIKSPMPGKVIQLNVKEGDKVKKGDTLMVIEAMKMENNIVAGRDASVEEIYVSKDSMVDKNMPLILLA
jgi:acetyl-CoA carboxylase biotin carboxylase subunit